MINKRTTITTTKTTTVTTIYPKTDKTVHKALHQAAAMLQCAMRQAWNKIKPQPFLILENNSPFTAVCVSFDHAWDVEMSLLNSPKLLVTFHRLEGFVTYNTSTTEMSIRRLGGHLKKFSRPKFILNVLLFFVCYFFALSWLLQVLPIIVISALCCKLSQVSFLLFSNLTVAIWKCFEILT